MSNEIAKYAPQMSLNDVRELAKEVVASKLFPGFDTVPAVVTLMMLSQAEGKPPIMVLRQYDFIKGKPAKKAMAILAEYLGKGGKVDFSKERTNNAVTGVFTHPSGQVDTVRWTIDDARNAGLVSQDNNWKKYPRRMLTWRVATEGVGIQMPGIIVGIDVAEEMVDDETGPASVFDKLSEPAQAKLSGTTVTGQIVDTPAGRIVVGEIVDAEIVDTDAGEAQQDIEQPPPPSEEPPPPPPPAAPATEKLAMPTQDCDRLPQEILRRKRKLVDQPFLEQSESDLTTTIATLRELANGAKDPHNKMVLQVYAAIADTCMNAKRKSVAP